MNSTHLTILILLLMQCIGALMVMSVWREPAIGGYMLFTSGTILLLYPKPVGSKRE